MQEKPVPLEPFSHSEALSLGVELELQLVNTHDYDLTPYAEDMLRLMAKAALPGSVVPEMTSGMIEISTGICHSASEVLGQLSQIRDALVKSADKLNIAVVGGGTHPFQQWHERRTAGQRKGEHRIEARRVELRVLPLHEGAGGGQRDAVRYVAAHAVQHQEGLVGAGAADVHMLAEDGELFG